VSRIFCFKTGPLLCREIMRGPWIVCWKCYEMQLFFFFFYPSKTVPIHGSALREYKKKIKAVPRLLTEIIVYRKNSFEVLYDSSACPRVKV